MGNSVTSPQPPQPQPPVETQSPVEAPPQPQPQPQVAQENVWVPRFKVGERINYKNDEIVITEIDGKLYGINNDGINLKVYGSAVDNIGTRNTNFDKTNTWKSKFKKGDIIRYNSQNYTINEIKMFYDEKDGKYVYNNGAWEDGRYVDSIATKVDRGGRKKRRKQSKRIKPKIKTKTKKQKPFTKKLI
jgi:hypothetical protein